MNVNVVDSGDFASASETGTQTVTIPRNTSTAMLTAGTEDDELSERDGSITATVILGMSYAVGTLASAMMRMTDDEGPTPQEQVATLSNALVGTDWSAATAAVGVVSTRFQPRLAGPGVQRTRLGLRLESLGAASKDALLHLELGGEYETVGGTDQHADQRVELTAKLRL